MDTSLQGYGAIDIWPDGYNIQGTVFLKKDTTSSPAWITATFRFFLEKLLIFIFAIKSNLESKSGCHAGYSQV